ncbi:glycosyltransferase [Rhodococcus sp. T9N]|jgi:UDP-N-acetylglucosamine--N-acetylmuramyl-(pentapeptide) pyrophosphoryl-undecaprenol N-acetylglucosamine transferase|uniref:glycosyltransferase n=1 Tax=Rhodococcus sp. T9N TaxID=627445 RepID=UPI0021C2823F|nr:glycosyltransferase [Rhodococcus sp. T9N]
MIGYYIHHHGRGHLTRAASIARKLSLDVTALTSAHSVAVEAFDDHVQLQLDYGDAHEVDPTANDALHWAPIHETGLRSRMARVARWVATARPDAVVVDVSVEIATFIRLMGVPVIVVAMPGDRTDAAHQLAYRLADHIIAAWPHELYDPTWLHPHAHKTTYVGGISRFEDRECVSRTVDTSLSPRVVVLSGAGGSAVSNADVQAAAAQHRSFHWTGIGLPGGTWVADPWPDICSSDIMVSHAGQNAVADIAIAGKPAIVIAQERPFGEQVATAGALSMHNLAVTLKEWPALESWPDLITQAQALDREGWSKWRTTGAADRAARVIESVAIRHTAR